MADVAIRSSATTAAPLDYKIPGAQEILPKVVSASLDGTGAASQFFAALQVLDPGGNVMFTSVGSDLLSPGASADVSWFPGLVVKGGGAGGSGAWTQVFHIDLAPTTTATNIDTLGSTWDSNANQIFGLFMGASQKASSPDELFFTANNDALSHYTNARFYGNANPTTSPGTVTNTAGGLLPNGSLGLCGATHDSLTTTAIFFVIPKIYQTTQSGKVISFGGYTGISTGIQGMAVSSYEFSAISRLNLFWSSGAEFAGGSALTLWVV